MSKKYNLERILNHFKNNNKYQYDISYSFTLHKDDFDEIEKNVDDIAGNLIPRAITIDIDGDYYYIVWLQDILEKDKYYSINSFEENNNITINITIQGKLHKIYHTTVNNQSFNNSKFLNLP